MIDMGCAYHDFSKGLLRAADNNIEAFKRTRHRSGLGGFPGGVRDSGLTMSRPGVLIAKAGAPRAIHEELELLPPGAARLAGKVARLLAAQGST